MTFHQIKDNMHRRVYAKIDLDAIISNVEQMKNIISPNTRIMAVIKTNGYGHGSIPIATVLEPLEYVYGFAVATVEEAISLRKANIKKPILILGYTFPECYDLLAEYDIRPAVFRLDSLEELNNAAMKQHKKMKIHVKVDTGMGRIGIRPDSFGLHFIAEILKYHNLEMEGVFTHFSCADQADKTSALQQLKMFSDFLHSVEETFHITIPIKHCSNSAGILELPQANMDMVRAGITLYGLLPSDEVAKDIIPLKPSLSLYSHIIYCKTVYKGEKISYGGTYVAKTDRRIATIPVGYGDGYPRSLSNTGYVLIHGKKAFIVGRVCMDQLMVDITDITEAKEGDLVTLLGEDNAEVLSAETLGELSGRFNYELVCDLGSRIPRIYEKDHTIISFPES